MLEVILLIVGIVKAVRRPRLSRLNAQDFPSVDPMKFREWQQAQLTATDIFLWATWGAFCIKLFLSAGASGMSRDSAMVFVGLIVAGWVIGLIVASVYSRKANRLRIAAGIVSNWHRVRPSKSESPEPGQSSQIAAGGEKPGLLSIPSDGPGQATESSPTGEITPVQKDDFRCAHCGTEPATNLKDGKRYCNDCLRTQFPQSVTIQRDATQSHNGISTVTHPQQTEGEAIMTDDLITLENVTKEQIKSVFDAAFMETSYDNEGDILVQERCRCYVILDKEKRRVRLHTQFTFKPDTSELQKLECVNLINRDYIIVRAAAGSNNRLLFTYDVNLDGGVNKKALVLLVKRFCSIPHTAVADYGSNIVE